MYLTWACSLQSWNDSLFTVLVAHKKTSTTAELVQNYRILVKKLSYLEEDFVAVFIYFMQELIVTIHNNL